MKVLVTLSLLLALSVGSEAKSASSLSRPSIEGFLTGKAIDDYNRIVGGTVVDKHSKPYQVALFLHIDTRSGFCGGILIGQQTVLTAAHCWYDGTNQIESVTVIAGAHNIRDESEQSRVTYRNLKSVVMHENWNPSLILNDIAIIHLPSRILFNEHIQAVDLPPASAASLSFSGVDAIASGWGRDSDSATGISEELRHVKAPVISNTRCRLYYIGSIQSSHICTNGDRGTGTCSGDSGGPLTTEYEGRTIVIGITSFGLALGCELAWPSAFTRVTSFLGWINENTAN